VVSAVPIVITSMTIFVRICGWHTLGSVTAVIAVAWNEGTHIRHAGFASVDVGVLEGFGICLVIERDLDTAPAAAAGQGQAKANEWHKQKRAERSEQNTVRHEKPPLR
jgi:dipeptide/tripeptide permease